MSAILDAFLDGFTGRGLLTRLRRPGSPTQVFADGRSDHPQSGLVEALLRRNAEKKEDLPLSDDLPATLPVSLQEITVFKRAGLYADDRNPATDIVMCLRDEYGPERTVRIVAYALGHERSNLGSFLASHFGPEQAGVILEEALKQLRDEARAVPQESEHAVAQ